ncbi:MAG: hypothetical protein FWD42_01105 [Solirubrobacterales bacterium]|nr:hypothetical protein [Solirubrobacterales bacterium]
MEGATLTQPLEGPHQPIRQAAIWRAPWPAIALGALAVAALVGFLAFPTYPTYDSFYALLWGRNVLHLHLPDLHVYRGPTEHPLAIGFGAVVSLFGQGGARLVVLGSIASFVALVAGVYRVARLCFGPVVGVIAGLLMLTRFFDGNLAAQGYLDLSYVALIVWALALELARPRRGAAVLVLLAAAGLLRPDAWVLSGAYWLWCDWPRRGEGEGAGAEAARRRLAHLALAALAPVLWMTFDAIVTGDPLHSLHATAELAQELERTQGLSAVVGSVWSFGVRIDHLPVVIGVLIGIPLAVWLAPRRTVKLLAALALLVGVFLAEGAVGASVVSRYLMGAAAVALPFCALTLGGWALLERSPVRTVWMAGALALVVYGALETTSSFNLTSLRNQIAYREDFHRGLAQALASPGVRSTLHRCPLLSLPNNKLIPDARWILGGFGQHNIVARSEARSLAERGDPRLQQRILARSVAVYPLGAAVFYEAIVDVGDDPLDQVPIAGFRRIYTSQFYAVYARC